MVPPWMLKLMKAISSIENRKYHRGQMREGRWVVGAIERQSGRCLMQGVEQRDRNTLEAVISSCRARGLLQTDGVLTTNCTFLTEVCSYMTQSSMRTIFVDPVHPDIHTNTIEGIWSHAKRKLRRQYGTSRDLSQIKLPVKGLI